MKKLKNIFIILLALSLTLGLFSCKKEDEGDEDSDTPEVPPISFLDYAMIRPENVSDVMLDGIADMYMKLIDLSGQDNKLTSDFLAKGEEPDSNAKEILIGHTNRPETEQVLSQLAGNEYAVAVVGNKIVVTGIADSLTPKAIEYFMNTYLADGADGMIEGDLFYKESTDTAVLVDKGEPVYTLVRQELGYEGGIELCYRVFDAVMEASGVALPIKTDRLNTGDSHDDNAFEILFGDVSYSQTETLKPNVDPDAYNIEFVGNKIVIYAWSSEGLEKAAEAFANMLTYACYVDSDGKATVCIAKESIKGKNDSLNFYMDVPYTAEGRRYDSVYNAYDGAMMLYWKDAGENILTSYAASLEKMGYQKYQNFENTSIESITYSKNKASVHIYYLKRLKEFRVVAQDNAVLPTNPYEYKELCKPAVTQLGIYHDRDVYIGMSYLIRLADGTFVVIDGGNQRADNSKLLYDTMLEQKPEELDDIVISAWIITHAHADHIGVFKYFMQHYSDKVIVKQLIGNDLSDFVYSTTDYQGGRTFTYSVAAKSFEGCIYTKAHTGQQFFFPGATFTIMYTHEDVYPQTFEHFNNAASLMFDANIEDMRFIWLADMENRDACKLFKNMYYTDMKCDVVQMGHHGMAGGSYDVYRLCDPDIAFWPAGAEIADNPTWRDSSENQYILNNVDQVIIHKDGSYTIWFEKTPDTGGLQGTTGTDGSYTENY